MSSGSSNLSMDAKGRIAIPVKQRDRLATECDSQIVMTAHLQERCLLIYPAPKWVDLVARLEALPSMNRSVARAQRLLLGCAHDLTVDANGRVLIPPVLRDFAGLQKKLVLLPIQGHFELWSEQNWLESVVECEPDKEQLEQVMGDFSL